MTQEEKQLLLKDLCARLPYGLKINIRDEHSQKMVDDILCAYHIVGISYNLESRNPRPYLRPLSSMTEEEEKELKSILREKSFTVDCHNELIIYTDSEYDCDHYFSDFYDIQDWLNKKGFDYRGLIPMGLALEAPRDV